MIIHADMDAFYASVEIRENPLLAGKPVAVGGPSSSRGVISAASYEARKFGVHSAMPTATAMKKCPQLILLPGRMSLYVEVSHQIQAIFAQFTPQIEPLSLDEAFLDVSASEKLFGTAEEIGRQIKAEIARQLGLVVSVGVAPNKFVAKIASDIDKPDGFILVKPHEVQDFLDPLPVKKIWGVGKVTEKILTRLGITTIKQLRLTNKDLLIQHFGEHSIQLWYLANGIDNRAVECARDAKSISHETTFARDISNKSILLSQLRHLNDLVTRRLRDHNLHGKTIFIKIRYANFLTISRSKSLPHFSQNTRTIWTTIKELFDKEFPRECPSIRLIGVGVSGLQSSTGIEPTQDDMFSRQNSKDVQVDKLTDQINSRFGRDAVTRGTRIKS